MELSGAGNEKGLRLRVRRLTGGASRLSITGETRNRRKVSGGSAHEHKYKVLFHEAHVRERRVFMLYILRAMHIFRFQEEVR